MSLGGTPGFPAGNGQTTTGTPGYGTTEINASGTTTTPSDTQVTGGTPGYRTTDVSSPGGTSTLVTDLSWASTVIEQSNADNNRDMANQRRTANSSLTDPKSLAGTQAPNGVGTWGYPNEPRGKTGDLNPKGADYQEQQSGVPYGLELNVGGTWFDGYRVDDGRTVLIDTKDWDKFVFADKGWWVDKITSEAQRQVNAAATVGGGVTIEWHVSTSDATSEIRSVIESDDRLAGKINVVFVPKGP